MELLEVKMWQVCEGVLRDDNGKWICGFSKWLGVCSAYVAELWGVLKA